MNNSTEILSPDSEHTLQLNSKLKQTWNGKECRVDQCCPVCHRGVLIVTEKIDNNWILKCDDCFVEVKCLHKFPMYYKDLT